MPTQQELAALTRDINNAIGNGNHFNAIEFDGVYVVGDELHARLKRHRALRHPEEYGAPHPATNAANQVEALLTAFARKHSSMY